MDTVFSTRLDERLISELERAAQRLGITRKALLVTALREHLRALDASVDVVERSFGVWAESNLDAEQTRARMDADLEQRFRRSSTLRAPAPKRKK